MFGHSVLRTFSSTEDSAEISRIKWYINYWIWNKTHTLIKGLIKGNKNYILDCFIFDDFQKVNIVQVVSCRFQNHLTLGFC